MLKVATWNHGHKTMGGRQVDRAWHLLLDDLVVDVALVQETVIPDWVRDSYGVSFLKAWPSRVWGSAVVTQSRRHDILLADSDLRVLAIRTDVPYMGKAVLASLHARIIDNRVIPQLRRSIEALSPLLSGERFVVGGDLNTARAAHDFWPMNGHREFWEWMSSLGWHDCLWEANGAEMATLWSPGSRPLQADHLFVDTESGSLGVGVEIRGQKDVGALSDHAVVIFRAGR